MKTVGEKRRRDLGHLPETEKELGKLVQFEKREKGSGAAKSDRAAGAEILMFTGIRYQRESDGPSAPTKPTASPGSKRKRG